MDCVRAVGNVDPGSLRDDALGLLRAMPGLRDAIAVGLVGSVARGTAGERSDVDVFVVLPDREIPLAEERGWWDAVRHALAPLGRDISVLVYTPGSIRAVSNWYVLRLASDAVFAHDTNGEIEALLDRVVNKARASGFVEREVGGRQYWEYARDPSAGWRLELDE